MGKIFDNPDAAMTDEILRPEIQDLDVFVDGINNIVEAQRNVAMRYLDDGSVEDACPPLKALLYIMATGHYQGRDAQHPEIRAMFTRDYLLASHWYRERLEIKQARDIALWQRHVRALEAFSGLDSHRDVVERLDIEARLEKARERLQQVQSGEYLEGLVGSIGADPLQPAREVVQELRRVA
jgi:hypothetical protein